MEIKKTIRNNTGVWELTAEVTEREAQTLFEYAINHFVYQEMFPYLVDKKDLCKISPTTESFH